MQFYNIREREMEGEDGFYFPGKGLTFADRV